MHIPTGYGQVNYIYGGDGLPTGAQITHGFSNPTDLDVGTILGTLGGHHQDNLRPIQPQHVTLNSILVKLGPNDTGAAGELGVGTAGTGSSSQVQPNCCLLVQKRTALGGRRNRGRLFWPITEGELENGGQINSGYLAGAATAWGTYFSDIATSDLPMVVLHTDPALTPVLVTSVPLSGTAATQRRRLRR